jgi:hypothetical protein
MITDEHIDVLCMQETNVDINVDHELLSFPWYKYENVTHSLKASIGADVSSKPGLPHCFASFLNRKINPIICEVSVDDQVCNVQNRIFARKNIFMDPESVI